MIFLMCHSVADMPVLDLRQNFALGCFLYFYCLNINQSKSIHLFLDVLLKFRTLDSWSHFFYKSPHDLKTSDDIKPNFISCGFNVNIRINFHIWCRWKRWVSSNLVYKFLNIYNFFAVLPHCWQTVKLWSLGFEHLQT